MKAWAWVRVAALMMALAGAAQAGQLVIDTLAGPTGAIGDVDFTGPEARFFGPAGVAFDGSFTYVADTNNNLIRKVGVEGETTTLAGLSGFAGYSDGFGATVQFNHPTGLAVDASGNLFVADTDNHIIRRISHSGLVTLFAGQPTTPGSTDGPGNGGAQFNLPRGLAFDASGNLLVADSGNHTIRMITPQGAVTTIAGTAGVPGSAEGTPGQFFAPSGVTVDNGGTIYVADRGNCTIRTISNGVVGTLAGVALQPGSTPGVGNQARFNSPEAILYANGLLYVSDTNNHSIRTVTTPGGVVSLISGNLTAGFQDGTSTAAQYNRPAGLALKQGAIIVVADAGNHAIRNLGFADPDYFTYTVAGVFQKTGVVNFAGTSARFVKPFGIFASAAGTLLVADPDSQVVRTISRDGNTVGTLCGQPGMPGTAGGLNGQLNNPSGVTEFSGKVYIADTNNHCLRTYDPTGGIQTVAGTIGMPGSADGQFPIAQFRSPKGLCVQPGTSTIVIADSGNHLIRVYNTSSIVNTIGGVGGAPGSTDGPVGTSKFNNPSGVASNAAGIIYVADTDNHTIRKIVSGSTSTIAGLAGNAGSTDGVGNQARFNHPTSLAIQGTLLYVTDSDNNTIRVIDLSTNAVTTVAGLAPQAGGRDGGSVFARFDKPLGVAVDSQGLLYITDSGNANIRKGHAPLPDMGTIDEDVANVGEDRLLDVVNATPFATYSWRMIRRPSGSTADLSDSSVANPIFTPDVADLYVFELRAYGMTGELNISTVSLLALPLPPVIDSPLTAEATVGMHFFYQITATNNPQFYGVTLLPPGLVFDSATGLLYGIPTTSDVYSIGLLVANGGGSDLQTLVLTVKAAPVVTLAAQDNPGLVNTPLSYIFDVVITDPAPLKYFIYYGDDLPSDSGTFTPGNPVTVQHSFAGSGDFTVTLTLKDQSGETTVATQAVLQTVLAPNSGGEGVKSASDDGKTVINPINGISIEVMNSNGGVIQLGIDIDSLDRGFYDASTAFGDIAGRSATVVGPRPVHQFISRGIFVAKTTGIHRLTGVVGGIARKTLVVGAKETGQVVTNPQPNAREARAVGDAPSSVISTKSVKGKFIFSGGKNDVVSYSGSIQLPAGLDVYSPHEFSIAIGNIVVDTTVDKKGKGIITDKKGILKKLKLTYVKIKKGTITTGGETARVDVMFNSLGMVNAGFDTEGIVRSAQDAAGGKKAPRNIQIAMLLDGVPYTVLAPVTFSVSGNTSFGSISGRSGF